MQPPTQLAQAEALASLIQATLTPIIGPLVGQLDAQRQTIEHQADRVAELERENGRLSAELASARTSISTLTAPGAPIAPGLTPISHPCPVGACG